MFFIFDISQFGANRKTPNCIRCNKDINIRSSLIFLSNSSAFVGYVTSTALSLWTCQHLYFQVSWQMMGSMFFAIVYLFIKSFQSLSQGSSLIGCQFVPMPDFCDLEPENLWALRPEISPLRSPEQFWPPWLGPRMKFRNLPLALRSWKQISAVCMVHCFYICDIGEASNPPNYSSSRSSRRGEIAYRDLK